MARVTIPEILYHIEFLVLATYSHDLIVRCDFLSRHHAIIDYARPQVELSVFANAPFADTNRPNVRKFCVATNTHIPPLSAIIVFVGRTDVCDSTIMFTTSVISVATMAHFCNIPPCCPINMWLE